MTTRFVNDINRLVQAPQKSSKVLEEAQADPIAAIHSIGQAPESPKTSSSAGLASPLTETPGTREYYESELRSSDGLFVVEIQPIKAIHLTDAGGNQIKLNYAKE